MSCWPTKNGWDSKTRKPSDIDRTDSPTAHFSTPTPTMKSSQMKNGFSPKVANGSVSSNFDYDTPPWRIDQPNGKFVKQSYSTGSQGRESSQGNGIIMRDTPNEVDITSWKIGPPLLSRTAGASNSVATQSNASSNGTAPFTNRYHGNADNGPATYSSLEGKGHHLTNANGFNETNGNCAVNGYKIGGADDTPFSENIIHELNSYPSSAQTGISSNEQVISYSAPNGSSFRVLSPVDRNIGYPNSQAGPLSTRSGSPILGAQQRQNMYQEGRQPQRNPPMSTSALNDKPKTTLSEWAFRPVNSTKYDRSMTLPSSSKTNGIHPENGQAPGIPVDDGPYMTINRGTRTASEPRRLENSTNTPSWNTQNKPTRKQVVVVENDYKFGKEITLTRKRFDSGNTLPNGYFDKIFEDSRMNSLPDMGVLGSSTLPPKIWPFGRDDLSDTRGSSGYDSPTFSPFSPLLQQSDPFSPNPYNGQANLSGPSDSNPQGPVSIISYLPTMPNSYGPTAPNSNGPTAPNSYEPTVPDSNGFSWPTSDWPSIPNPQRPRAPAPPPDSTTAPIKGRTARADAEGTAPDAETLAQKSIQSGMLYRDPEFPAEHSSLYFSRPPLLQGNIEWKRPHEICSNPQFVIDDRDRFDVVQGQIGDCWLVSAIAGLTLNKKLLERVCPQNQSFDGKYAGVFSFWFWRFGKWKEVVVDDRLPTIQNRLIYVHSSKPSEFWSALVEKAYAKIMGSYEALEGGVTSEGFTDFTGGIVENVSLRDNKNHWKILLKAFQRGSFMGCGIAPTPGIREQELANGLVCGHAYTITSIKQIQIAGERQPLQLIRLRNPWGSEHEWKGAWSDRSPEWQRVPQGVKTEINLTAKADGEFWMSFDDFRANFPSVDLCHLPPDAVEGGDKWNVIQKEGSWVPGVSGGGCGNYQDTFYTNPQYQVSLSHPDDGDQGGLCTIIVSMTQKNRRKKASEGAKNLTIGYSILKAPPGVNGVLDRTTIRRCETVGSIPSFINSRDISHRHELPPGDYVIVPSTFKPNVAGEFLLRIYTEKAAANQELDEETSLTESLMPNHYLASPLEKRKEDEVLESFDLLAGEDGAIDAWEMKKVVSLMFTKDFPGFDGFGIEAARSMIAMHDGDISGKLGRHEFITLFHDLNRWKKAFKEYDADQNVSMDISELRNAFNSLGFKLSNRLLVAIAKRYGNKAGCIDIQDFILCACRLKTMIKTFQASKTNNGQSATFPIEEFMTSMMYS